MGPRLRSHVFLCIILLCACSALCYQVLPVTPAVTMGESPFWDDVTNTVIFVDVIGQKILRHDPKHPEELKSIKFAEGCVSPAVPVEGSASLLVGVGRSLVLADVHWGAPGEEARLHSARVVATADLHHPGNRFNDGKADPQGRLWVGTMDDSKTERRRRREAKSGGTGRGSVYRFDLHWGGGVHAERVLADKEIPNGMVWAAEESAAGWRPTYYLADSEEAVIYAYDFHSLPGRLSGRRVAFDFKAHNVSGVPDGFTVDVEGNLWVACVHGGQVIRVDPRTGRLLQTVPLGVDAVSAVEWGGPQRDVLYVASSRFGLSGEELARQPDAGRMFAITGLGARGYSDVPYKVKMVVPAPVYPLLFVPVSTLGK